MREEYGNNPLLHASKELFRETYRISQESDSEEVVVLSRKMSQLMDSFSNRVIEEGVDSRHLHIARYLMCTFCDELIANAPSTSNQDWGGVSLLSKYYQESYGGDKFFQLLEKLEEDPTQYIHILELAYVCLSFDFGGKYKQRDNGLHELGAIKENLYRQIKTTKPQREKFYAHHPVAKRHHKLYSKLSKKVIFSTALLLMMIIYTIFTYTVDKNESSLIEILKHEYEKIKDNHGKK